MIYEIIPGILEKEWGEIEKKLNLLKSFTQSIHIDILDNKFAPNLTILDPKPFKSYSDALFLELHLMVDNPIEYVEPFAAAGFKRFLGHIEMMPDQQEFVNRVKSVGAQAGLAIDGPTSLDKITIPYENLDALLVMTIKAGFSGQEFMPANLEKVKALRQKGVTIPIEIDGGVNAQTILLAKDAGVDRFSATSALYKSPDPKAAFEMLQDLVNNT